MQGIQNLPLRWMLSNGDLIDEFTHLIAGEVLTLDSERREVWAPMGTRLMNDEGIRWLITTISPHISKNTQMTQLDENWIRDRCRSISRIVAEGLVINEKRFEVSKYNFFQIKEITMNLIELSLRRGKEGLTLRFLEATTQQNIAQSITEHQAQQQSPGLGSKILGAFGINKGAQQ
jgi:hypothetical protein